MRTDLTNLLGIIALLGLNFSLGCALKPLGTTGAPTTLSAIERTDESVAITKEASMLSSTLLQVHYIDVGTGDCIWIITGDHGIPGNGRLEGLNIIIDGGDAPSFGRVDGYKAASQYLTENDKLPKGETIDWMILSHPHSDHCGGLDNFLDDYDVLNILDPGHDPLNADGIPASQRPNSMYGKFFNKAATEISNGTKANYVWGIPADLTLDWGEELEVKILHSSTTVIDNDLNNTSIVFSVGFADPDEGPTFLFTGDAEEAVEEALVASLGAGLKADVLKAGHHGSKSSSTTAFLEMVQPAHIVICSGNQSFSGSLLPAQEALDRMAAVSLALGLETSIWRTDRDDKEPTFVPRGEEAGDDTVVAIVEAGELTVRYADEVPVELGFFPEQCQGITLEGVQCKRSKPDGSDLCWQHD